MRDFNQTFLDAIKEGTINVCELFEFNLRLGTSYYFTSHDEDIDWGTPSKRYRALPIQRSNVSSSINLEADTVEVMLSGITEELFDAAEKNLLDGVLVVIKLALWDQNSASGCEYTVFSGIGAPLFNRERLSIECSSIFNTLNVIIPRNNYQQPCNYGLFDYGCSLRRADFKTTSIATSSATNSYTVFDSAFTPPVGDTTKYNFGEIEMTSGNNIGQRRMILTSASGQFIVAVPFSDKVEVGDEFDYYPGCDGSKEVCRDRFDNADHFYGFVYLPPPETML